MATDVTGASPLGLACPATTATGAFTSDGNAVSITAGFLPRFVVFFNETDSVKWEKVQGMATGNAWKSGGGSGAIDTSGAIMFPTDPGLNEPGSTVLCSAAMMGSGKKWSWIITG